MEAFKRCITIFSQNISQKSSESVGLWQRTVIKKASWHGRVGSKMMAHGLVKDSKYVVRIDESEMPVGYLCPATHNQRKDEGWSVQPGDLVVAGCVDVDISGARCLAQMGREYFTVSGCVDNRRGPAQRHLRIEGG